MSTATLFNNQNLKIYNIPSDLKEIISKILSKIGRVNLARDEIENIHRVNMVEYQHPISYNHIIR